MKKLLVMALTAMLVIMMAVPAFAADYDGSEVTEARWNYSDGRCTAHWEADHRSKGTYHVVLYRNDGHKIDTKTSHGGSSVNFTDSIADHDKTGDYYFTVNAKWPGDVTDSEDSDTLTVDRDRLTVIKWKAHGSEPEPYDPGVVTTGWQWDNNCWKYMRPNGTYAANCWEFINGKWYSFDGNGVMRENQWIRNTSNEHIWYYVGGDGAMVTNTTIDGWTINAEGECYY